MGWIITLGILGLLAVLPLGVGVKYDAAGPLVKLIAGPVKITLFPRNKKAKQVPEKPKDKKQEKSKPVKKKASGKKKTEASRKSSQKKTNPAKTGKKESTEEKSGGSFTDFLPLLKVVLELLNAFRRKLRVDRLEMKLVMAGDDPCDLAINYGKAWAAVGNLMPQLEKVFVIKKRDIDVACDFTTSKTTIYVCMDLTITLGRVLVLAVVYGFRAIREFLKIYNKRKGGASK